MRATPDSGIALIMVLGLLTVMVLMAVTFAISMRTERLAAGNAADTVRAREMVHAALARALSDLAVTLGTNGLNSHASGVRVGRAYPIWSVTNSHTNVDGIARARWAYTNALVKGDATNYVPGALLAAAMNADYANNSNHWLPVESLAYNIFGQVIETNLMGRVAYVILNCSGLLDANYAGSGSAPRGMGTNPSEIAIANLDEIGAGRLGNFIDKRDDAVRFETMAHLNSIGSTAIDAPASNLFVYSRALPGYWDNALACVGTQVNLAGEATNLIAHQSYITNAFVSIGFGQFEAGVLYSNLIDYVDDDLTPSNFEYCVEAIPMINEIVVSNGVEVTAGSLATTRKYRVFTDIFIETFFPFVKSEIAFFTLNVTNTFSGTAGFLHPQTPFTQNNVPVSAGNYKYRIHIEKPQFEAGTVNSITLIAAIDPKIQLGTPTVNGDILRSSVSLTTTHDGSSIGRDNKAASYECLDPRFNYNPADAQQWRARVPAITASDAPLHDVNPWIFEWWAAHPDGDLDFAMHVANEPLESVAELGCLVYTPASPWQTVKLYGPARQRVLDVFGIKKHSSDAFITNIIYRGLVNPSPNVATDATAIVLADMPVNEYPGQSTFIKLSMDDDARPFVSRLYAGGSFTNLSDVSLNLTSNDFTKADSEIKRESYFRNAFNLFNLRQNMFTIILEAQAASGGNLPRNPARQRAVVIVWRDPYTGEMFVRHIKWLED
ncbi:MAG: hypothetical protein WC299_09635 [Kiritimatiellia bacterium]